jgi:hypothetical protein
MCITAFNNLDHPSESPFGPFHKGSSIAPISPDMFESSESMANPCQYQTATVTVLDICRMNNSRHYQTQRVNEDMPFAAFHLFTRIVSAFPPFSVLTVWLSSMAALAVGL